MSNSPEREALEPDPIPVLSQDEGIATDAINFVRTQTKVVPFVAVDSNNFVVFGPFPDIEHAVESIKHADFTWDEFGSRADVLSKTALELEGWKFLPLMDLDLVSTEERRAAKKSKFIDQPGQVVYRRAENA